MAISMAPGLSAVVVYEAPNELAFDIDVLDRIATDNLAKQISCSWNIADATTFDQKYQQCAAQGQSFFKSSGDNGAFTFLWPNQQQADSPYVTLVGGTTLTTTGPEGDWLSETVWNWNTGTGLGETNDASGGGISSTYPIPLWQQGVDMTFNQGSTLMRNIPDVAMVADDIYVVFNNGSTASNIGGTSVAAPLWAAFTALVNQQAAAYGEPTVGFINPAIYAIGTGTTYAACFHDYIPGNNETYYSPFQFYAAVGYDLCTGWGTPNGSNLVNALAPQPESDLTRGSDSLDNTSVYAGSTVTASITITNEPCPGASTAAGPFHVGFYWSTDSSFSGSSAFYEAPVSGCPNGGSVSITQNVSIPQTTSPGTYYLGYNIDDSNEVVECNENDKGIFYWTVTVLPAPACTFVVSPLSINIPAKGGSKTLKVKAEGTDCTWTAASNDSFITITEGTRGTGNGIVRYIVPGNTNNSPLPGTITVAGQTVAINQAAGGCAFKLSPKIAKFTFIGTVAESKTVNVKANFSDCTWTAVSNDSFITITGGASGVGNGTVSYTVAENPNNNTPRSGTITIGGEEFTITQSSVLP
jgi:subtilase family serine protease